MRGLAAATAMASLLALAACGRSEDKAGGLTAEENRQLDNAAEMLDTSPDSLVPADDNVTGNGEAGDTDSAAQDEAANSQSNSAQ